MLGSGIVQGEECIKTIEELLQGNWVERHRVEKALDMSYDECWATFDYCRTAAWWSIVGKTEEERSWNGQKVTEYFRVKPNKEQVLE